MDVDTNPVDGAEPAPAPAPLKKKRIVKKIPVPLVTKNTSLDKAVLESYKEKESEMHAADKLVQDTEVFKFVIRF